MSDANARWLVIALAILTFIPGWGGDWVLDDHVAIAGSACVTGPLDLGRVFASNFWCEPGPGWTVETWRPLTVATWWLTWHLSGGATWAFDALNLTLHAAASLTLWRLARDLGATERSSLISAGLFASLAIHTDAVAAHIGGAGLGATLFTLLAMRAAVRGSIAVLPLCVVAALCKETGVLAIPLVVVVVTLGPSREPGVVRRARALAALSTVAVLLVLVARAEVLGGWTAAHVPAFVNPLVDASRGERVLVGLDLVSDYVWLTLAPSPLGADYAYDSIGTGPNAQVLGVASGAVLVVASIGLGLWHRRAPIVSVATLWVLGCAAFVSNAVFLLPAMFAERVWYLGSAGLVVLAGTGLDGLVRRTPARTVPVALAIFVSAQIAVAWRHSIAWRSAPTILDATLAAAPRNARAHHWRASEHFEIGELGAAREHAEAALAVRPNAHETLVLLAILDDMSGNPERAVVRFRRALELAPHEAGVAGPFVQFLLKYGQIPQAQFVFGSHARARGGAPDPSVPVPPAVPPSTN